MIDLRNSKIFFIALIVSIVLHVTILSGLSGFINFDFLKPVIFKVVLINLAETQPLKNDLKESTGYNPLNNFLRKNKANENRLLENAKGGNLQEYKAETEEERTETRRQDAQTTTGPSELQGEPSQAAKDNRDKGKTDDQEAILREPGKERRDEIVQKKSEESSDKREPLQITKTSREIFYYDISWLGIYVGEAVLEAVDTEGLLRITSQVHSAPVISAFYKVDDFAESTLSDGIPVNFRIKQHEGKYSSDKETIFDIHHKIITFFNYLKGTKDEHALKDGISWDVISGFYYLRTQTLEVGKPVYINIFDSNKFYRAKIDIIKKEKIKLTDKSEIDTIVVKPTLESEGLFQRKGDILIWISDDEKRIPVRVSTKVQVGSVVAELRKFTSEK